MADTGNAGDAGNSNDGAQAATDGAALGDGGKAALAAERRAKRTAEAALAEANARLAELENAGKSELERSQAEAATAKSDAATARLALLRYEVAAAKDIPLNMAGRLQGSTREELEADAAELLKMLPKAEPEPSKAEPLAGTKPTVVVHPTNSGAPAAAPLNGDPIVKALKSKLGIQ